MYMKKTKLFSACIYSVYIFLSKKYKKKRFAGMYILLGLLIRNVAINSDIYFMVSAKKKEIYISFFYGSV